ncbi:MAG: YchJ family metal-binding protein [Burkholderiaceae bacterium]
MARTPRPAVCPCGGRPAGAGYAACCGRYVEHFDTTPAPDAEALMRSRYSAFVRGDAAYLQASWHAGTRPATLELEPGVQWLGLELLAHRVLDDTHAEVEFVARSRAGGGPAQRLHERSRFVHECVAGVWRWYYVDGTMF